MARGVTNGHAERPADCKVRFFGWEVDSRGVEHHQVSDLEPVTLRFRVEVCEAIPKVRHGIALYDHEQRLVWAWTSERLHFDVGSYELCHTLPMLPIRPGQYTWHVSLFESPDEVLDHWYCTPQMIVATTEHQSPFDEWTGILNLPTRFEITSQSPRKHVEMSAPPRS